MWHYGRNKLYSPFPQSLYFVQCYSSKIGIKDVFVYSNFLFSTYPKV